MCLRVAHTFTPKRYVFLSVLSLIIILRAGEQVKGKYLQGISFPKAFSSLSNSGQWFASGFFFGLKGEGMWDDKGLGFFFFLSLPARPEQSALGVCPSPANLRQSRSPWCIRTHGRVPGHDAAVGGSATPTGQAARVHAVREELLVGERAPDSRADPHRGEALRVQRVRASLHHQGQPEGECPQGVGREAGARCPRHLMPWKVLLREAWEQHHVIAIKSQVSPEPDMAAVRLAGGRRRGNGTRGPEKPLGPRHTVFSFFFFFF